MRGTVPSPCKRGDELPVYLGQPKANIAATVATLRYFRAFLASDCVEMVDPYSNWMRNRLTKTTAARKLTWLVNMAINRKAGITDSETDWPTMRLARDVNTPRILLRERAYMDVPAKYRARVAHRFSND